MLAYCNQSGNLHEFLAIIVLNSPILNQDALIKMRKVDIFFNLTLYFFSRIYLLQLLVVEVGRILFCQRIDIVKFFVEIPDAAVDGFEDGAVFLIFL